MSSITGILPKDTGGSAAEWKDVRVLDANMLKLTACTAMLIDHAADSVLWRTLESRTGYDLSFAYAVMRAAGRAAFPIFCFFLVEGFQHTKSRMQYLSRLVLFALISEIPFDLCLSGTPVYPGHQNVYCTLALGLAMMMSLEWEEKREHAGIERYFMTAAVLAVFCTVAYLARTDYDARGIVLIFSLYILRKERTAQVVVSCISLLWEPPALMAIPLLLMYNGKRGRQNRRFFYWFYPVHLLVLFLAAAAVSALLCFFLFHSDTNISRGRRCRPLFVWKHCIRTGDKGDLTMAANALWDYSTRHSARGDPLFKSTYGVWNDCHLNARDNIGYSMKLIRECAPENPRDWDIFYRMTGLTAKEAIKALPEDLSERERRIRIKLINQDHGKTIDDLSALAMVFREKLAESGISVTSEQALNFTYIRAVDKAWIGYQREMSAERNLTKFCEERGLSLKPTDTRVDLKQEYREYRRTERKGSSED